MKSEDDGMAEDMRKEQTIGTLMREGRKKLEGFRVDSVLTYEGK